MVTSLHRMFYSQTSALERFVLQLIPSTEEVVSFYDHYVNQSVNAMYYCMLHVVCECMHIRMYMRTVCDNIAILFCFVPVLFMRKGRIVCINSSFCPFCCKPSGRTGETFASKLNDPVVYIYISVETCPSPFG